MSMFILVLSLGVEGVAGEFVGDDVVESCDDVDESCECDGLGLSTWVLVAGFILKVLT